jgi:hypothetical protein
MRDERRFAWTKIRKKIKNVRAFLRFFIAQKSPHGSELVVPLASGVVVPVQVAASGSPLQRQLPLGLHSPAKGVDFVSYPWRRLLPGLRLTQLTARGFGLPYRLKKM